MHEGDVIRVHFYSSCDRNRKMEIQTKNYGREFLVYSKNGKLGIDWNTSRQHEINGGDVFTPFEAFAGQIVFEAVKTGEKFHFDHLKHAVEKIQEVSE